MESKHKTHPRCAQEPRLWARATPRDCPLSGSVLIILGLLHNAIKHRQPPQTEHPWRRMLSEESADLAPCPAEAVLEVMGFGDVCIGTRGDYSHVDGKLFSVIKS